MIHRHLGIAALALGLFGQASACGFEASFDISFALPHPRSLEVAMAVYGALSDGRIDAATLAPGLDGEAGLQRATWRLQRLGLLLGGSEAGEPAIALVLVDSALWARLTPAPLGASVQMHVAGPAAGDVVAVSSELVLAQWLDGRLSGADALRQGMLLLEGPPDEVQRVSARFARIGASR
jgi:hypothetical protein